MIKDWQFKAAFECTGLGTEEFTHLIREGRLFGAYVGRSLVYFEESREYINFIGYAGGRKDYREAAKLGLDISGGKLLLAHVFPKMLDGLVEAGVIFETVHITPDGKHLIKITGVL